MEQPPDPTRPKGRPRRRPRYIPPITNETLMRVIDGCLFSLEPVRDEAIRSLVPYLDDPADAASLTWHDFDHIELGQPAIVEIPGERTIEIPDSAAMLGWQTLAIDRRWFYPECDVFFGFRSGQPRPDVMLHPADIVKIANAIVPLRHVPDRRPIDCRDSSAIVLTATTNNRSAKGVWGMKWGEVFGYMRRYHPRLNPYTHLCPLLWDWYVAWGRLCGRYPLRRDPLWIPVQQVTWTGKGSDRRPQPLSYGSFRRIWRQRGEAVGLHWFDPDSKLFKQPTVLEGP